ncbi:MAG: hypothetical protein B7Z47_00415 [Chthoniobacter sp. 12-60-6]|nr:MAG: hypothetical protein B7Z47_00415 [Chthoniobacter sp. 12-60-6]
MPSRLRLRGPTRIGHYFIPQFATANGTKGKVDQGPVLTPGKLFDWPLVYDPNANDGDGELRVTLGTEFVTLALKPGQKKQGAILARFGLFTSQAGGQMERTRQRLRGHRPRALCVATFRRLRCHIRRHARAQHWLIANQKEDGGWPVDYSRLNSADRSKPEKASSLKNATMIYSYWGTAWSTLGLLQGLPVK